MTPKGRLWSAWVASFVALGAVTAAMYAFRGRLDKAHTALVYLVVVLAGSMRGGRRLGLALAGCAFLLFNWFFLPPYGTLTVLDPLDWLVLGAFLIVSGVAAQMLHREQMKAEEARQRAQEVDRMATLGAETLNVARADEALAAISGVIRDTLNVGTCRIHVAPHEPGDAEWTDSLVAWALRSGQTVLRHADGTNGLIPAGATFETGLASPSGVRELLIPLRVRDRTVGVLELTDEEGITLDQPQRRFLAALAYYAALGVERVRLTAEASRVEVLREADRLKDALIASVSHDLRTPLTTIKALAHDLRASGDDRAVTIEEEADRLNRLVVDLLDLSRLQAGSVPLHLELNAADDLLGALVQRVSGALDKRELKVVLEEEEGTLLLGRFDLAQSLRVLVNLVENAHKYAAPGTPIEIRAWREDGQVALAVSDRGPGVPVHERERIFEPFYRPPGRTPDVGGAGLGLAIARRLAEAQGGTLTYETRAGGGSVFTLRLPASDLADTGADFL
jgi:two-component system, OmpR family, sensor histidine kinase KdpD